MDSESDVTMAPSEIIVLQPSSSDDYDVDWAALAAAAGAGATERFFRPPARALPPVPD